MLQLQSIGNESYSNYNGNNNDPVLAQVESDISDSLLLDLEVDFLNTTADMDILFAVVDYEEKYGRDERAETIFSDVYQALGNEGAMEAIKLTAQKVLHWIKVFIAWVKDKFKAIFGTQQSRAKKFKELAEKYENKENGTKAWEDLKEKKIKTIFSSIKAAQIDFKMTQFTKVIEVADTEVGDAWYSKGWATIKSLYGDLGVKSASYGGDDGIEADFTKEAKEESVTGIFGDKSNYIECCKKQERFAHLWAKSPVYALVEAKMQKKYNDVAKAAKDAEKSVEKEDYKNAVEQAKNIKKAFNAFRMLVDSVQGTIIAAG